MPSFDDLSELTGLTAEERMQQQQRDHLESMRARTQEDSEAYYGSDPRARHLSSHSRMMDHL